MSEIDSAASGQYLEDDDDDDFGEFGGFEGAEPVAPGEARPGEATIAQWAVFPVGVGAQPDLIQTSTSAVNLIDGQPPSATSSSNDPPPETYPAFDLERDVLTAHNALNQVQSSFLDLDLTSTSSVEQTAVDSAPDDSRVDTDKIAGAFVAGLRSETADEDAVLKMLEDLDLDRSSSNTETQLFKPEASQENGRISSTASSSSSLLNNDDHKNDPSAAGDSNNTRSIDKTTTLSRVQLSALENEKSAFKKELERITASNKQLEIELETCRRQLETERQEYEKLQTRHRLDLDAVRKAGHDAVALIVEEYKQLCKVAILEQQEVSERHLQDVLKTKAEMYENSMHEQRKQLNDSLEQDRIDNSKKIHELIADLEQKHREELEKCLSNEREKSREAIKLALLEERDTSQKTIETVLQQEREKSMQLIRDEKGKMANLLDEEKEKCRLHFDEIIREEREKNLKTLETAFEDERKKSADSRKQMLQTNKAEMNLYVDEQRQRDKAVNRRQLSSLDVFLEGARKQLDLLMASSTTELSDDAK
ncbi:coiled-coil domain-containing protein 91-like [Tubulanus polymorphus]|uniref:coiled-coil domain-containing protein 91-like n=1 Tax=Tubulanus polymorphus TaxID=672921 RepID=UPI003DA45854